MQVAAHLLRLQAGILTAFSPCRIINAQERAAILQALDGSAYQARLCRSLQPHRLSAAPQFYHHALKRWQTALACVQHKSWLPCLWHCLTGYYLSACCPANTAWVPPCVMISGM